MRVLSSILIAATLAGCTCYALCRGYAAVQLTEIPDGEYEVTIELPGETVTWSCDGTVPDDELVLGADCESGYFEAYFEDKVETALITVDGVTTEYASECVKNKTCGQKCWQCTFYVE